MEKLIELKKSHQASKKKNLDCDYEKAREAQKLRIAKLRRAVLSNK